MGAAATVRRLVRQRDALEPMSATVERYERASALVSANETKGSAFWLAVDQAAAADREFAAWLGDAVYFDDIVAAAPLSGPTVVLLVLRDGAPIYRQSTFRGERVAMRSLRFEEVTIAHASSREGSHDRAWLEVTVYAIAGDRDGVRRWVIHRAGHGIQGLVHSSFAVVRNGPEALKYLADEQTGWVAATALETLDKAVRNDAVFAASMGDLLADTNFREITGGDRVTQTQDRRVLEALAGGAVLVALGPGTRKIVWQGRASNVDRPTPAQFLQLSRRGFIKKRAGGDGFSEWTISARGKSALSSAVKS